MNIIILQEGYDPNPDPNSICTKALVDVFKQRGDNVYVVCDGVKGKEHSFSKDESIIHVAVAEELSYYRRTFWGKVNTLISRFFSIPIWPIRFPLHVTKYVNTVEGLLSTFDKDSQIVIISVYRPAEMVEVGYRIKKMYSNCHWIIYSLDGIGSLVGLKHSRWLDNKEKKWNYNRCESADLVIQMQAHKKVYINSPFVTYLPKTMFLDFPLIVKSSNTQITLHAEKDRILTFVYGGAFYKGLREPFYLLSWFKELIKYRQISFSCYTKSVFQPQIEQVSLETNGYLQRLDYITPDEMKSVINQSDFVVNIGNASSPMVPSKVFVYMSACKPIIHFISDDDDSCLPYLNKYPLALIIDQRESIEMSVKKTLEFLDRVWDMNVSFQDIERNFPKNVPAYTVDSIREWCYNR